MGSQDWSVLPRFRLSFSQFSWFNSQEKTVLISRRSFPSPEILFWFNCQDFLGSASGTPEKPTTPHMSQKDSPSRPFPIGKMPENIIIDSANQVQTAMAIFSHYVWGFYQLSPPWGLTKWDTLQSSPVDRRAARGSSRPAPWRRSVRRIGATSVPPRRSSPRTFGGFSRPPKKGSVPLLYHIYHFCIWKPYLGIWKHTKQKWGTRVDLGLIAK